MSFSLVLKGPPERNLDFEVITLTLTLEIAILMVLCLFLLLLEASSEEIAMEWEQRIKEALDGGARLEASSCCCRCGLCKPEFQSVWKASHDEEQGQLGELEDQLLKAAEAA